MQFQSIETFEQLREYLASFSCWGDDPGYDCGGVVILLSALIDNLRENSEEALSIVGGYLSEEQKRFLELLAEHARHEGDD
jgi:hypothetical protein